MAILRKMAKKLFKNEYPRKVKEKLPKNGPPRKICVFTLENSKVKVQKMTESDSHENVKMHT